MLCNIEDACDERIAIYMNKCVFNTTRIKVQKVDYDLDEIQSSFLVCFKVVVKLN